MQVGLNAYALYKGFNDVQSVVIESSGVSSCVQGQKTLMGRVIIETTLEILILKLKFGTQFRWCL
jgi:molybdopterin-containing oxidoreductase family iron-sulfur binding subunit